MGSVGKHIDNARCFKPITSSYQDCCIPGQSHRVTGNVHYPFGLVSCKFFADRQRTTAGRVQQNLIEAVEIRYLESLAKQVTDTKPGVTDAVKRGILLRPGDAGRRQLKA